ncbi:Uncharacterised protein [Mycobacteroides abscessus subsp. abscessus]|nr:Uncharacterised protein [Mycobacteroides abscessus subsp. abscessus]
MVRPAMTVSTGMDSRRSCLSLKTFGEGRQIRKSRAAAEINAASGRDSSTCAPPADQLSSRFRIACGVPGITEPNETSTIFQVRGANVSAGSSKTSDRTRHGYRIA